tara:strand:+ start:1619 stop:1975 length:357 start_codon:yes stop_codon:yes gene_type:complete
MIRSLPNGVHTNRLLLPIFELSNYHGWQVDLGAKFLQLVGLRITPLNYSRDAADDAQSLPFIQWLKQGNQLQSVVGVDDHQFHWPERICIDGILDAERMGAVVLNYTAVEEFERVNDV